MKKRNFATRAALACLLTISAAAQTFAGAVPGPKTTNERVQARSTDSYAVVFRRGEIARVALSGDGDTDLDLYVYDESGNLVASDDDELDDCYVSWAPRWTGNFTIKVVNRGYVANDYTILTN